VPISDFSLIFYLVSNDQSSFYVIDLKLDVEPSLNAAGAALHIMLQHAAALHWSV